MKKVRITGGISYRPYIGMIGDLITENEGSHIWTVIMEDETELLPYAPSHETPQCELVPEEIINQYQIF